MVKYKAVTEKYDRILMNTNVQEFNDSLEVPALIAGYSRFFSIINKNSKTQLTSELWPWCLLLL
jgi:hypothetical protein